jgi:hypothetical protein
MPANFDLTELALKALAPNNVLKYDDKGNPSIMVRIPKMTYAQLGLGASTATFPAFIVNGQEVSEILISKYQNIVVDSRAYSLPGEDAKTDITFDQAIAACTAKGAGWHLMTALEWGALIAWCEKNGFIPLGNVAYGKYHTETSYKAIPANKDGSGNTLRTMTGTGPLEWYHDKTPAGIADLCGSTWEWTGGIRTVYGELQILANNNAADKDNSQAASSAQWMAIKAADGTLITPDGSGATTGSVKMDFVSDKIKYDTTISSSSDSGRYCQFKDITYNSSTISAETVLLLRSLGMLPVEDTLCTSYGRCYFNNGAAERAFFRGGSYSSSGADSFPSFSGYYDRGLHNGYLSFRSAYVEPATV